jgi:hypothetical protein
MKGNKFLFVLTAVLVFASLLSMAFVPMPAPQVAQEPVPVTALDMILKIAVGFGSLAGISALIAVVVQVGKVFRLVKDGTSSQWTSALNLLAFIGLIYFGVFQPSIAIEVLDGYAAQVAQIGLFVLGFVIQMTTSKPTYDSLKSANVPLLRFSYNSA